MARAGRDVGFLADDPVDARGLCLEIQIDGRLGTASTWWIEDQDVNWSFDLAEGVFDASATVLDVAAAVELHIQLAKPDRIGAFFHGDDIGSLRRQPGGEHADPGIRIDDPVAAAEPGKRDGTLIEDVALPRIDLDERLRAHAEMPAGIVDADRVVVEI